MERLLPITFDPAKDAANRAKHGVSLVDAERFEFETALVAIDNRADYGERREIAIGFVGSRLHVMVFTLREEACRVISLRKANSREVRFYEFQASD